VSSIRNISILWLATVGGAGLSFLAQVLFARLLTPTDYGILASALVTVTMLAPMAGFGVGPYWLRVFGAEGWRAQRWLRPSLRFVTLSSLTACAILLGWAWLSGRGSVGVLVVWMSPLVVAMALIELVTARLQLEERYSLLALWQTLPHVGRLVVALVLTGFGGGLWVVGVGFSFVALLIVTLGLFSLSGMLRGGLRLVGHSANPEQHSDWASPRLTEIPVNAWPFALAGIFYFIYFQSDILLLNWLVGAKKAGIYNVAFTVMVAVYLIPGVIYQKYLLPKQHRWADHDRDQFLAVYRFGCGSMLTLGLVVMVILMLMAPWGVPLLFGKEYSEAGKLLLLLVVCVPFRFLATSVGGTLIVQEHMRSKVLYMGVVAVVNISFNLILIPTFSYYGAAAATVASEVLLLAIYLVAVRRRVFGADAWRGWTLRYRKNNVTA